MEILKGDLTISYETQVHVSTLDEVNIKVQVIRSVGQRRGRWSHRINKP